MTGIADATDTSAKRAFLNPDIRTPEMEMAERGEGVPSAVDLDLAEIRRRLSKIALALPSVRPNPNLALPRRT